MREIARNAIAKSNTDANVLTAKEQKKAYFATEEAISLP